jgi:cytochrome c biogenesis protein CcdA
MSTEVILRYLAVLSLSIMMIAFGWYFTFATDTLQHDWIYLGGGALVLLMGIGTLFGMLGMIYKQVKEWGPDGLDSDAGIVDEAPVAAKNARPAVGDEA